MPFFAFRLKGSEKDAGVCQEENLEDVKPELILGPGDWVIREIDEREMWTMLAKEIFCRMVKTM